MIEVLGWMAIVALFPATWFQIIKNFKRKSVQGVSSLTFLSLFLGMTLFLTVSLLEQTPLPVLVNFGLGMLGAGVVLLQMRLYRKRR